MLSQIGYTVSPGEGIERGLAEISMIAGKQRLQRPPGAAVEVRDLKAILGTLAEQAGDRSAMELALDVPLESQLGRFVLRGIHQFVLSRKNTLSVRLCEVADADRLETVGTVIVKTIAWPAAENRRELPPEARFYQELGPRVAVEHLRIPALYAVNRAAAGHTQLFIEHLSELGAIDTLDGMCRAARIMGGFAGHCHAARLYEADWLPRGSLTRSPRQIVALEQLLTGLAVGEDERADILETYRRLLDRMADLDAAHARELPTLCHGDLFRQNLLAWRDGFAVIDWEKVHAGRIGDDLGKLAFQWTRAGIPQAEASEDKLIAAYIEGAAPFVSSGAAESICRVYRARSVFTNLGKARVHWRWASKAPNPAIRRRRMNLLVQHCRRMALRAQEVLRRAGCWAMPYLYLAGCA